MGHRARVTGEWQTPVFENGWGEVEYLRVDDGTVHLRGFADAGTIFTLPDGYMPQDGFVFAQQRERDGRLYAQLVRVTDGRFVVERERDMGPMPYDPRSDPNLESVTYGQGSFGYRCASCRADDYSGEIAHAAGCPLA